VKLRDVPRALGLQAESPRVYPSEVAAFDLPRDGIVHLARWRHPGEKLKSVTQEEVDALRRFLREGDVAIDIGAHTGDSTLPLALAAGPTGLVFALEPNPYVFAVLERTSTLNPDKARIVPLMFAATPEDGEFEFTYSDAGYCNGGAHPWASRWRHGHFSRLRVVGRNLDRYLLDEAPDSRAKVRYIKVDTEGSDRRVVASLASLISTARPYLKTEIYKHLPAAERSAYYDDLRRLGYRVLKWEPGTALGQELQRGDLSRWRHFDVFAVPEERI
jgi:FkbM family methyltransferase